MGILPPAFERPSHLKIPGGPKMARAALNRRAMCSNVAAKGAKPVSCLAARRATYGPYGHPLNEPFKRAENGPSQIGRPAAFYFRSFCSVVLYQWFHYQFMPILGLDLYMQSCRPTNLINHCKNFR